MLLKIKKLLKNYLIFSGQTLYRLLAVPTDDLVAVELPELRVVEILCLKFEEEGRTVEFMGRISLSLTLLNPFIL